MFFTLFANSFLTFELPPNCLLHYSGEGLGANWAIEKNYIFTCRSLSPHHPLLRWCSVTFKLFYPFRWILWSCISSSQSILILIILNTWADSKSSYSIPSPLFSGHLQKCWTATYAYGTDNLPPFQELTNFLLL